MNLEYFRHRSVISFLTKEGIAPNEIYESLVNVNRDRQKILQSVVQLSSSLGESRLKVPSPSSRSMEVRYPKN